MNIHRHHGHSSCGGHHHHTPTNFHGAFAWGIVLNVIFVSVEFFFGWSAHSLALLADAAHNLGDVLALLVAWLGYYLMQRKSSAQSRFTFGLGRVSIYATLFNGFTLVVSSLWIIYEAIERFGSTQDPIAWIIAIVATIGIATNGLTAWLLSRGQDDVNIKGAMMHMLADALVSAGVVLSAILLIWTGWHWLDPLVSTVIAVIILWGSWPLLREGTALALDAVPGHLNRSDIETYVRQYQGVDSVHSLYIWPLSTAQTALNAHLRLRDDVSGDDILPKLRQDLVQRFRLSLITIQVEATHESCIQHYENGR